MLELLKNRRAQSTAEYAVIIALIIGAAVAMQTYVSRSMKGQIKYAVDKLKTPEQAKGQYEPYYLQSQYDVTTSGYKDTEELKADGELERTIGAEGKVKTTTRKGSQTILDAGAKIADIYGSE